MTANQYKLLFSTMFIVFFNLTNAQSTKREQNIAILKGKKEGREQEVRDSITLSHIGTFKDYGFKFSLDKQITQQVIEVNEDSLYHKVRRGIIDRFVNPDYVMLVEEENSLLRYKGLTSTLSGSSVLGVNTSVFIQYLVDVEFKENKVRVTFTQLDRLNITNNVRSILTAVDVLTQMNKSKGARKYYADFPLQVEAFMNNEVTEMLDFSYQKNDW